MKGFVILLMIFFLWRELALKRPDELLHIVVCDVGQGDAILLSFASQQILIDTGPNEKVLVCLNDSLPFWDRQIEVLVLTHFDEDHIGGFKHLAQSYQISRVFLSLTDYKESSTFLEMQELLLAMQAQGTKLKQPFLGQQISLVKFEPGHQAKYNSAPSLELTFLTPYAIEESELALLEERQAFAWQNTETKLQAEEWQKMANKESNNNGSIALYIVFNQLKVLLLGDLEIPGELALLERGLIMGVDIQKIGHHGSKTASGLEFLLTSRPEIGLISCGLNNKFSHPHPEVLDNLGAVAAKIWRTDELGSIEIVSDGQNYWLKNKNHYSFWNNGAKK